MDGLTGVASADSDGDGVSNLLEFVLGGDPTENNSSILPTGSYDATAGAFTYHFDVAADLGTVSWVCQYSSDLATWVNAVSGTGGVLITEGTAVDGYIPVTITIPSTGAQLFVRLAVTTQD